MALMVSPYRISRIIRKFLDNLFDEDNPEVTVLVTTLLGRQIGQLFGDSDTATTLGMIGGLAAGILVAVYTPEIKKFIQNKMTEEQRTELCMLIAGILYTTGLLFRRPEDIMGIFTTNEDVAKEIIATILKFIWPLMQ